MLRKTGAFLLAPFPAAFFQAIIVGFWPKKGMGVFEHPSSMFVTICLLFYVFGLVIGIPLFLLLRKRIRTLRDYALAGMAIILLPVIVAMSWAAFKGQVSSYVAVYDLAFFAIGGSLAGALFRLLTRPKPGNQ